jgi:hypothetical protein
VNDYELIAGRLITGRLTTGKCLDLGRRLAIISVH